MRADCFRVKVPAGARLTGFTANGQRVRVLPGEHVVHRWKLKAPLDGVAEALRFLGADEVGRDVHVPVSSVPEVEAWLAAAERPPH